MTVQTCSHCRAPVRGDGRPTCLCAAVDAEDFDPLRIRPYVSLPGAEEDRADGADEMDEADGPLGGPLWGARSDAPLGGRFDARLDDRSDVRFDAPVGDTAEAPPAPLRPPRPGPTSRTFRIFHSADASADGPDRPAGPSAPRKRAVPALLAVTGAAVAATAVLIGAEAFSGGQRDRAAPPDRGTTAPTAAVPTHADPHPSRTATPAAPARSAPAHPTGTAPAPGDTPAPYRTAPPPPAPTRVSGSVDPASGGRPSAAPTGPIVLREGSSGPEVAELQNRLRQLGRYPGPADGSYDADLRDAVARYQEAYGVTGDPTGVYGARTRASLESLTQEPGTWSR
ncbi:peptidoglycan-binding domain-containing protein [Streptomyces natalensis]|uniref:peptidoglycan-binding domain-containing protein n=1 Tax=Streptomyces natalensis TaxID=68242 RepID=UPI00069C2E42|nr:peptidoglycan-binding domain-containing protein [Streptomyces natalensis]